MELLRQGPEALGEQRHALDVDARLAGLRLENIALGADDVAYVELAEVLELLLADGVGAHIELDLPAVVLDVAEYGLAHAALGHYAARDGDALILEGGEIVRYLLRPGRALEARELEGVAPGLAQLGELLAPHAQDFAELLGGLGSVLCVFPAHSPCFLIRWRRRRW